MVWQVLAQPQGILLLTTTGGTSGTLGGSGTLSEAHLIGLLSGFTYVNVHTENNGPGEIRGQIASPLIDMFSIPLAPLQEVPAPSLGGATPSGSVLVVTDSNSLGVEVSGSYMGMTSDVGAAHLHGLAPPGVNAGVLIGFDVSGGTDGTFTGK